MAPLTGPRATNERSGNVREIGLKANAKVFQGGIGAVGADGYLVPMSTATTLRGVGRIAETVDNTGGADNAVRARIDVGIFCYANSGGGDAIGRKDIGQVCYGVDDQTVALTNGTNTRSIAGKIFDVDAQGVWVDFS